MSDAELEELGALEPEEIGEKAVGIQNGMRSINGLTTQNGMRSINGLTTKNGLRMVNGMPVINGLATKGGLNNEEAFKTINGRRQPVLLNVNCQGGQTVNNGSNGGTCTGEPDGLLSRKTGLMSSDDGILVARYLVRCALPPGRTVRVKSYTGALVAMRGELGLASNWLGGDDSPGECDEDCQEVVSACLMALTSATGVNHDLVLTSPSPQIGLDKDSAFPYQEAVFYGNLFAEPPQAFVAAGPDFGVFAMRRADSGDRLRRSTYEMAGAVGRCAMRYTDETISERRHTTEINKCSMTNVDRNRGVATACAEPGSDKKTWKNPITTYRKRYDFPQRYWGRATTCQ
jgi:hypothetical protein